MKLKLILLSAIIVIEIVSCKKKDEPEPVSAADQACTSTTTIAPCSANGTKFHATLSMAKSEYYDSNGNVLSSIYFPNAYFSSSLTSSENSATAIQVDTVNVNGVNLKYDSANSKYMDSTYSFGSTVTPLPPIYQIKGKNGFPSFSFTDNGPYPDYTGQSQLPGTIDHTQSLSITMTGLSNFSSMTVMIGDGNGNFAYKYYTVTPSIVTFTTTDLAQFTPSTNGYLSVYLSNSKYYNVYGKIVKFSSAYSLFKTIIIQ
jgi:hypothetical protein